MLDRHLFVRRDNNDILFSTKENIGKDEIVSKCRALRVLARCSNRCLRSGRTVELPSLSVEARRGLWLVVQRRQKDTCKSLEQLSIQIDGGIHQDPCIRSILIRSRIPRSSVVCSTSDQHTIHLPPDRANSTTEPSCPLRISKQVRLSRSGSLPLISYSSPIKLSECYWCSKLEQ